MRDLTVTTAASMSSREISELTGKRHDHVLRDIRVLVEQLEASPDLGYQANQSVTTDSCPQTGRVACYHLDKDTCLTLVLGYDPVARMKVVKRWQELEAGQFKVPSNFADALRLAADQQEQIALLSHENQQQSEKIDSLESLFKEGMTATQFCKLLNGVNVMAINSFLFDRNWLYNESKTGTRWRTASYARDRYLTEHQSEITPHGQEPFIKYTPVLLRKGAVRLHELYLAGELPMKKSWNGQFAHDKESLGVAV